MAQRDEQQQGYSLCGGEPSARGSVADPQRTIAMLRETLEGATEMIAVEDTASRYLAFNRAYHAEFKKVFGVDLEIGTNMIESLAHLPVEQQTVTEIFNRTMSGEDFTEIREFGDTRGGRYHYELHCFPLRDAQGDVIGGTHIVRDVTEQQRTREALRTSEDFKSRMIANSDDCIKVLDLELNILMMNEGGRRLMEIENSDPHLHSSYLDLWDEDNRPKVIQAMEAAKEGGVGAFEGCRPSVKGTPRWWDARVTAIPGADGRPERLLVIARDITGQKRDKETLQRERAFFRQVIDATPSMVFVKDRQGRFVLANAALAHCYGTTADAVVGRTDAHFNPNSDELERFLRDDLDVMDTCRPKLIPEEKVTFANGERHWFSTIKVPLIDEDGACDKMLGVASDITARKQAEEGLRLRNERLTLLSEAAAHLLKAENPESMILELVEKVSRHLDIQGYMNFMVNEAGDALRLDSYAGVPEETARSVQRLEFGQGVCGTVARHCRAIHAVHIQQSEIEIVQLLKSIGIRAYACNPLLAGGRLLGTLAFATTSRDAYGEDDLEFMRTISQYVAMAKERLRLEGERRRHIEQLATANEALAEANERLAEADRRKDEFLAMLAHELRNPLAPIRNAMQVLRMVGLTEPIQQRQGDIIDRQIAHMAHLLNDLLDVSRITRGKIELNPKPLALADVLTHAVETARPLIETRRHTLTVASPPPELRVLADLDRLAQIVGNLLTNAAKYTPEGGRIWLEAAREGSEAVIRVRDTGVGIAPELLPRIFELFAQADQSLARSQGGLGIGLTMVRRLVEMHGGGVEAHSAGLGQGSQFTVRLPALAHTGSDARRPDTPRAKAADDTPPQRVLVVDDIADTAQSLSELLELWGHQVRVAYDGLEALDTARAFQPEVVLLDIGLPSMNGFEVARHLRARYGDDMVLIALTGYGQIRDREAARISGFDEHLVKPVDLDVLRNVLRRPTRR